ncbi:MAG TPA: hypothetical protein PKN87_08825 [Syntrophomonadaceae bacterium]|nr:hypothetical protein [Syntrophomonadaceae bacterium]HPR94532.1 hypothetical protein [Syntrophomonadaceae bacterium]
MIIAKRCIGVVMFLIFFIIFSPLYGEAENKNEVEWEIKAYDNHTIKETVKIYNNEIIPDTPTWEKSVSGEATILTRTVDNWSSYNELNDKLPIEAQTRNFFLWQKISLLVTADKAPDGSVFAQTKDMQGIKITILVPGYIAASNGNRVDEMSTTWELDKMEALTEGEVMLQAITFDGFLIGLIGFLLGLIIIGIVYIIRVKKVEQMMETEYSLENINLEELQEKENDNKNEDDDWN